MTFEEVFKEMFLELYFYWSGVVLNFMIVFALGCGLWIGVRGGVFSEAISRGIFRRKKRYISRENGVKNGESFLRQN